jgi:hypothetical protein
MIKSKDENSSAEATTGFNLEEFVSTLDTVPLKVDGFDDLFTPEESADIIRILSICKKYNQSDWLTKLNVLEIQADLVILQTIVIQLLSVTSRLIATSNMGDDYLKTERSKLRLKCKQHKGRAASKLNIDDVKDISYSKSEGNLNLQLKYSMGAEFCKYLYYSTNSLIQILDKAVGRLYSIERTGTS